MVYISLQRTSLAPCFHFMFNVGVMQVTFFLINQLTTELGFTSDKNPNFVPGLQNSEECTRTKRHVQSYTNQCMKINRESVSGGVSAAAERPAAGGPVHCSLRCRDEKREDQALAYFLSLVFCLSFVCSLSNNPLSLDKRSYWL